MFIGIPASGKSTFYRERFFKTHIRINLDMLRTRNRENILIDACIRAKQPFVIDNTNPSAKDRAKYIEMLKNSGFKVTGYYFKSSFEDAVSRNNLREGTEKIPLIGLRSIHSRLELPSYEEGFNALYYVCIDKDRGFSVEKREDEV